MEPEPSLVSSNDDRDLLVYAGGAQELPPAIHGINADRKYKRRFGVMSE